MPDPGPTETEQEFVSRCIKQTMDDGTTDDPKQAAAICYSKWENKMADKALLAGRESSENLRENLQRAMDELYRPETETGPSPQTYVPSPWVLDTWPTMGLGICGIDGKYYLFSYLETEKGMEIQARNQWQSVEERKEWIPMMEKAGRRLRTSKLKFVQDLKDRFSTLMDDMGKFLGWAGYEDQPEMKGSHGIKLFKGKDKKDWILVWSTNGFEDRDEETFRTKAIEEYVQRHAGDETKGAFDFWHVPGSEFGTIRWQGMSGRFLAEMGTFDDTPVGKAFKAFFEAHPDDHPQIAPEGWGASHEFKYRASDRNDGVYDWFDKEKTTVLPGNAASNPHNPKMEVMSVNKEQQDALKAIEDETGATGLVEMILKTGEERTKELEAAGVRHKAAAEKEPEMGDKAITKSEGDGDHPASHYLVVEDPEKPTTWHLRVKDVDGAVDHRLMGASWAALHQGYRGNKYEGPEKQAAIKKLTALYKSEDMTVPGEKGLTSFVAELLGTDQPKAETKEATVDETKEEVKAEETPVEEAKTEVTEEPKAEGPTEIEALREETAEALKMLGAAVVELRAKNDALETEVKELRKSDKAKVEKIVEETPRASLQAITRSAIGRKETQVDGRTTLGKDKPKETESPIENTTGVRFINNMLSGESDLTQ